MRLRELLDLANIAYNPEQLQDHDVLKISINSKDIVAGTIFVALCGHTNDGHDFIQEAIANQCQTIVYEEPYYQLKACERVNWLKVPDSKKALSILCRYFYQDPSRQIYLVGVTGTNGKTTTTSLIHQIHERLGEPTTLIGTNGIHISKRQMETVNTTPNSIILNQVLKASVDQKIKQAVMEVSSIAVKEQRVGQIDFDAFIYTNFSLDHLDYHQTFDDYFYCKSLALSYLGNDLSQDKFVLWNGDCEQGKKFLNFIQVKNYSYGLGVENDFRAREVYCDVNQTSFSLWYRNLCIERFTTDKLFGFFNVYNLLGALSYFYVRGYDLAKIKAILSEITQIPGRFERVEADLPFPVFVDYAHTPKGVYKVLSEVKMITKKQIITVIGCGGDRDPSKRPIMGRIATELSDFTIFTSDNPRSEDPNLIIAEMMKGVVTGDFVSIPDRKLAIEMAISLATKDSCVLILGKGHEEYQIINGEKLYFSDQMVAKNALNKRIKEES